MTFHSSSFSHSTPSPRLPPRLPSPFRLPPPAPRVMESLPPLTLDVDPLQPYRTVLSTDPLPPQFFNPQHLSYIHNIPPSAVLLLYHPLKVKVVAVAEATAATTEAAAAALHPTHGRITIHRHAFEPFYPSSSVEALQSSIITSY